MNVLFNTRNMKLSSLLSGAWERVKKTSALNFLIIVFKKRMLSIYKAEKLPFPLYRRNGIKVI